MDEKIEILREIRDRQKEALELQKEQYEFVKAQYGRAEAIQDKAEGLQDRATKAMKIIMPLIFFCLILIVVIIGLQFF